jgi:hypothetical protein
MPAARVVDIGSGAATTIRQGRFLARRYHAPNPHCGAYRHGDVRRDISPTLQQLA